MRRLLFVWLIGISAFLLGSCKEAPRVKYVFYFIGDGM